MRIGNILSVGLERCSSNPIGESASSRPSLLNVSHRPLLMTLRLGTHNRKISELWLHVGKIVRTGRSDGYGKRKAGEPWHSQPHCDMETAKGEQTSPGITNILTFGNVDVLASNMLLQLSRHLDFEGERRTDHRFAPRFLACQCWFHSFDSPSRHYHTILLQQHDEPHLDK